ncbi:hypothetical protein ACIRBX_25845 [Kitasatospora sp. NPDC096147]|uniref:hypothetical protein n=1 Tax=Kitasatospora sp. NPDC096147 TaxID=3364093 RepID=UPI0037F338F9
MTSEEHHHHDGGPGDHPTAGLRLLVRTGSGPSEPAREEPVLGEAGGLRPVVVVVGIAMKQAAQEALAERLGPGHILVDIREAGPEADLVLIPPASAQLLGILRHQFPQARILVTEFTDPAYGADFRGPISRILDSDVDGYFMAPTMDHLARITATAGRAVAGALTSGAGGTGGGPRGPVDLIEANRRLLLESGSGPGADPVQDTLAGPLPRRVGEPDAVTIDLDAWARSLDGDAGILAELAWPLILQLLGQGLPVEVLGEPSSEQWRARARTSGVRVAPSR